MMNNDNKIVDNNNLEPSQITSTQTNVNSNAFAFGNEPVLPKITGDIMNNVNGINSESGVDSVGSGVSNGVSDNTSRGGAMGFLLLSIFGLIVIAGSAYMTYYLKNILVLCVIPIYMLIGTIFSKNKDFSTSLLLGGVFGAICLFVFSVVEDKLSDVFTYLSIGSVAYGILSCIISSLLFDLFHNSKSFKGIQLFGLLLILGGVSYGIYYALDKYPGYVNEYVLCNREVVASTEKDYIKKILEQRYGVVMYCDTDLSKIGINDSNKFNIKNQVDQNKRKSTLRYCSDSSKNIFTVDSYSYSSNQYVVFDTYFEETKLNSFKENLSAELEKVLVGAKVTVRLYPKSLCSFIGDCVDVKEYYENFEKENDFDNQYNNSYALDLKKYVDMKIDDFVNVYGFKYQIIVEGNYDIDTEDSFYKYTNSVLEYLNDNKLKNNFGYEIRFYNVQYSGTDKVSMDEKFISSGETNGDSIFLVN